MGTPGLLPPGVSAPTIAPRALADKLQAAFPLWAMGLEEPGLARHLASRAFLAGDADLRACGLGLALWSWQRAPLDRQRADLLAELLPDAAPLKAWLRELLRRLDAPLPEEAQGADREGLRAEVGQLVAEGGAAQVVRALLPRLRDEATGLAWLALAWDSLLRLGSLELCRAALSACPWPEGPEGYGELRARLEHEALFFLSPLPVPLETPKGEGTKYFTAWETLARAEMMLRTGEGQGARLALAGLFAAMPWNVGLGLKLHALASPGPVAPARATGGASILVYSWNKAALARQTLESLARTDCGDARIFCLDNGSSDGTGEAMQDCAGLFAPGALSVVRLPVNVGAPAARNWLLSLPEVQARPWAVFLDDDVVLPERWLRRLLGQGEARPQCGAVGCRIVSASGPACLQSADYQLFLPDGQPRTFRDLPENVVLFDNCAGQLDLGLFTYARPASHVSGCCHALRTEVLRELGGFDIRFSPTQFDDLDRDLRSAVAGRPAAYAGDVAVAHVQHSSLAKAKGPAAMGQVFGNKIKLEGKFSQADMDGAARRGLEALWADMAAKWGELSG